MPKIKLVYFTSEYVGNYKDKKATRKKEEAALKRKRKKLEQLQKELGH